LDGLGKIKGTLASTRLQDSPAGGPRLGSQSSASIATELLAASNPVHSRAAFQTRNCRRCHQGPIAEREISDPLTQSRLAAQRVREIG
jgi:hypothetical protein